MTVQFPYAAANSISSTCSARSSVAPLPREQSNKTVPTEQCWLLLLQAEGDVAISIRTRLRRGGPRRADPPAWSLAPVAPSAARVRSATAWHSTLPPGACGPVPPGDYSGRRPSSLRERRPEKNAWADGVQAGSRVVTSIVEVVMQVQSQQSQLSVPLSRLVPGGRKRLPSSPAMMGREPKGLPPSSASPSGTSASG